MTQDPTRAGALSSDKVAELEKRLADAAAEVARVQAQLTQAQHAGDPPPPTGQPSSMTPPSSTGVPGSTIPPVPYGDTGASPHVITINGQQVVPGSGNLFQVLQQLGKATAGTAGAAAPVVMVNGQTVSGGQPVDISSYLTPQVQQQIQTSLHQLGLDHGLSAWFGHPAPPGPPPSPESVARLAEPPRPVPFTFRLATFDLSVWEVFVIAMGAVAPIAVWMSSADARAGALVAAVLGIVVFRIRRYIRRIRILKWGKVATVTNNALLSRGTYYSGTTYRNMFMRQANGWDVTTQLYSGPGSKTQVDYTLDGQNGSINVRGLPYTDGVVLADSRKPGRAMVVSQFPYSVKPDENGQYVGNLSAWRWGGIIATLVIEATLVYVAVIAVLDTWVNR